MIDAPPARVWAWLEALPDHYRDWHPGHISCRWVKGRPNTPGAVMEAVEVLHGRRHRLRMRLTLVEPGRRVEYQVFPGLGGGFQVEPAGAGSAFTATIRVGFALPVLGPILDRLLRRALGARLGAIRRHQEEEGANLKSLLEAPAATLT